MKRASLATLVLIVGAAAACHDIVTSPQQSASSDRFSPVVVPVQPCVTTVTEGDLFPGGLVSFGVSSGPGSVTVDHVNAGTGLQSFTVVGTPTNAVVTIPPFTPGTFNPVTSTFTRNPSLPTDFTLRAASTYHAIFIRVQCHAGALNGFL